LDHPLFLQLGNLEPADAKRAVMILTLLVGAAVAWMLRSRYSNNGSGANPAISHEWAATCIFCAILSPLCWRQHLVLLIPAALLLARSLLAGEQRSRMRLALLSGIAAACFLTHRTILGKELTIVLLSYHVVTFASVAMAFLVLAKPVGEKVATSGAALPRSSRQAA
jgi:hypothetical protein